MTARLTRAQAPVRFTRGPTTWLIYGLNLVYVCALNMLGPMLPFLRAEFSLSYTTTSLHSSALAFGLLLTGLLVARRTPALGWGAMLWLGAGGLGCGSLLIGVARQPVASILGAFVLGAFGALVLILVPTVLAALHPAMLGVALGEAALAASLGGSLAPLAVGWSATTSLEWRGAAGLVVVLVGLLALAFRGAAIPGRPSTQADESEGLPLAYWSYWLALLFAIAVEFCIVLWSASFLEQRVGLSRAASAAGVSVFLVAMLLARFAGSRVAARWSSSMIFQGSLGLAMLGVGLYWGGGAPLPVLIGLGVAGLGVANLYPHGLALALGAAPGQVRLASARASLTSGLAIMGAPLLLGNLADRIGISSAQGIIVLLLALAFGSCRIAAWLSKQERHGSNGSKR